MTIIVRKGGPGSGHFLHRGRPGKRGGSLPGDPTVQELLNSLDPTLRHDVTMALDHWEIPERHLEGLQGIQDELLDEVPWPEEVGGFYYLDEQIISIRPEDFQNLFVHELGHHVAETLLREKGFDDAASTEWGYPVMDRLQAMSRVEKVRAGLRPEQVGDIFEVLAESYVAWRYNKRVPGSIVAEELEGLWEGVLDVEETFKHFSPLNT